MKRRIIAALALLVIFLTGCSTAPRTRTLFDSETVKVEQRGRETIIRDVRAGKSYILRRRRVRKSAQRPAPKTLVRTSNLEITAQGSTTVIKTSDGLVLTIERNKIKAHQ